MSLSALRSSSLRDARNHEAISASDFCTPPYFLSKFPRYSWIAAPKAASPAKGGLLSQLAAKRPSPRIENDSTIDSSSHWQGGCVWDWASQLLQSTWPSSWPNW